MLSATKMFFYKIIWITLVMDILKKSKNIKNGGIYMYQYKGNLECYALDFLSSFIIYGGINFFGHNTFSPQMIEYKDFNLYL